MKWTVFLVEGQTEQVFLQKFIEKLVVLGGLSIQLKKLHAGQLIHVSNRGPSPEDCTHLVQIINVQGDDTVNSYISENLHNFKKKGVHAIYGLRDRFTGSAAKKKIEPVAVDEWTARQSIDFNLDVQVTIALEEVEAWFLSVPCFFHNYHPSLTMAAVNAAADMDLAQVDVEAIVHPSALLRKILQTVGLDYKKRLGDSHKIAAGLDYDLLYLEKSRQLQPLGRLVDQLTRALP